MSNFNALIFLALLCSALLVSTRAQKTCPIPADELPNYISRNPNVFATEVQAHFHRIPGSPQGGALVTWQLTYPACVMFLCVDLEIPSTPRQTESNNCLTNVSATSLLIEGLRCNIHVQAKVTLAGGGKGRVLRSRTIYIGGARLSPPSAAPPNLRAYLDNGELVLMWDVMECELQNSPIQSYFLRYNRVAETSMSLTLDGSTTETRSSSTQLTSRLYIPDLSRRYQFTVAACSKSGGQECGPASLPLDIIPANQSPIPTISSPTTSPPTTTSPLTTQPPTTTTPPAPSTHPPTTPPPPTTSPPTVSTTTAAPPTTRTTTQRQTTPTVISTTPPDEATTTPSSVTGESNSTDDPRNTEPNAKTTSDTTTADATREKAVSAIVGILVIIVLILLILSGIIIGWMMWRHRFALRRKHKRYSISGPIVADDGVLMEVKRDSQLLQTSSQSRASSKEKFSKGDKNIYDELKASEPKIKSYKRHIHVGEGEEVTLKVGFSGFPKPGIDWFHEGMRLDAKSLDGREILNDGSIFIKTAEGKHSGTYDFIVSNSLGSVEGCSKLIVYVEKTETTLDRKKKNGTKLESHIVKKERFAEHVSHCHTFNNKGFTAEYQSLLSGEDDEHITTGRTGENRFKNRYKNITPYDKHRLVLEPINYPECHYDYINASYIDGYIKSKRYIAAQGPLPSTVLDFWRMIWQEKVQTIAMVTSLTEGRQKMCEQYWPTTGSAEYGPFMVTLVETQVFADYTIRTFQLVTLEHLGDVRNIRKVTQYQFISWPDHGTPEYPGPLLTYLHRVKSLHKPTKGPILVHCSAGVGRTGTLISIDIAMAQAARENVIDIAGIVCKIRTQRMKLVQSPEQYAFIHDAVLEGLSCGDTQIPASSFKKAVSKLSNKSRDTSLTGFDKQFETLEKVSPQPRDLPRTVALRCTDKNRSNDFLPPDRSRVWLKAQNMDKTYIHATSVNGYKQKNAFIITQAPMAGTTEDFWRMVYEKDCSVIVMLSGLEELEEETCYRYWPDNGKTAINGEKHGTHTVFTLERKRQEGFLVRTFGITDPKDENMRRVTQFQMAGWSQDGVCLNPPALMKLIDQLMIAQRRTGDKPIIVHGCDTVSRCGVFVSLLNCIDTCKSESMVDVFQTVKAVRLQKPGAVLTVEQYTCLYELMCLYLSSFSLYSNFK